MLLYILYFLYGDLNMSHEIYLIKKKLLLLI